MFVVRRSLGVAFTVIVATLASCAAAQQDPPVITRAPESSATVVTTVPSVQEHSPCPKDTVLVEGDYCPEVEQVCLQWVDSHGKATKEAIPKNGGSGRCGVWKSPSRCLSKKLEHKRFCVDAYEYPNIKGQVPISWVSWEDMKGACEGEGKRLCTRSEWTFACEGPEMHPYPYGDGFHRDRTACNIDNQVPKGFKVLGVKRQDSKDGAILDSFLVRSGSMKDCVSPFGAYDMVGNLDESVVNEFGKPYKSGLMSGHVFGVRNACRPMTIAHNESFSWYETGGRCCLSLTN